MGRSSMHNARPETYRGLGGERSPAVEGRWENPQRKVRNGHLPEGDMVQVAVLVLALERALVVHECGGRLGACQV